MIVSALSGESLNTPIYISRSDYSITSLSTVLNGHTRVYFDDTIGHLQTNEIADIGTYYDTEYHFYDVSDEDDILYKVVDGKKVFRQEHQVNTLLSKLEFGPGMRVLDYGCAKGTVMKRLQQLKPEIMPHLFDVSRMYVHLWEKFLPGEQYASYEPKSEWRNTFDLVTSFFAFEHVQNPLKELAAIRDLLKPGGLVYMIVPNVYENTADFIVADHVHHYSGVSLAYMFGKTGFEVMEIDASAHFAAFIVVARKTADPGQFAPQQTELKHIGSEAHRMAGYWSGIQSKIDAFENGAGNRKTAIYGAGVYGTFIAASLANQDRISCFIDQNPLLEGTTKFGKTVVSPKNIPADIERVYVGLNPLTAMTSMAGIDWNGHKPELFFL